MVIDQVWDFEESGRVSIRRKSEGFGCGANRLRVMDLIGHDFDTELSFVVAWYDIGPRDTAVARADGQAVVSWTFDFSRHIHGARVRIPREIDNGTNWPRSKSAASDVPFGDRSEARVRLPTGHLFSPGRCYLFDFLAFVRRPPSLWRTYSVASRFPARTEN